MQPILIIRIALVMTLLIWPSPLLAEDKPSEISDYEQLQLLADVMTIVRHSYVEEVSLQTLVDGAVAGMLDGLDPHSSFMPPDIYKEMQIDTRGEFGGIGIEITFRDNDLLIVAPIEGTPAERAGLKAGDKIVRIENQWTDEIDILEAVDLMRGPAGSEITITIDREELEKPKEFTMTREIIQIESVRVKYLGDGIGYARIAQFQERTAEELGMALAELRSSEKFELKGLVLDVRNNPGGLLDQAVKVSDLFLEQGLIVYTEGREEGSRLKFTAHQQGTEPEYPMVVLINSGSASASEIVAGALQDHHRAVVVGTKSFGKGSVQSIIPLNDGSAVRLTTARYFTPSGTSIQARGIQPDIDVPPSVISTKDSHPFREKDLTNHMTPSPSSSGAGVIHFSAEEKADFQLQRAVDLLTGWQVFRQRLPKSAQ